MSRQSEIDRKCVHCGGSGRVWNEFHTKDGEYEDCKLCDGTGIKPIDHEEKK